MRFSVALAVKHIHRGKIFPRQQRDLRATTEGYFVMLLQSVKLVATNLLHADGEYVN